jgi:sodium/bile acid cotransporter 7
MIALQLLAPFVAGHMMRPWIGAWAERNRGVLSVTDRGSILLVNYTSFSAAVINGVWLQVSRPTLLMLVAITGLLLALALAATHLLARALRLSHDDEITALLCGSQKSLVSGVPIANVLFGPASAGPALLPIMVYYPLQLVVGSMLAKSLARRQAPAYGQA